MLYSVEVQKVIDYIEAYLNEALDIEHLAKVAGYSPYHFSRIFKLQTGENIHSMIKRLRLAQSTHKLLYQKESVTQVGLNGGYERPSSFNKAFKQMFGLSPTQYRQNTTQNLEKYRQKTPLELQIVTLEEEIQTYYHRKIGEYNEAALGAWGALIKTMEKQGFDFDNRRYFGICYDNPNITQHHQMRYEACLTLSNNETPMPIQSIPKGRYVVVEYQGDYDDLYDMWITLYSWIDYHNYRLDDFPPLEEYLDNPKDVLAGTPKYNTTRLMLKIL